MTDEHATELARRFHETYERLAPQYGYETRAGGAPFDPTSGEGKLVIAVCRELTVVDLQEHDWGVRPVVAIFGALTVGAMVFYNVVGWKLWCSP